MQSPPVVICVVPLSVASVVPLVPLVPSVVDESVPDVVDPELVDVVSEVDVPSDDDDEVISVVDEADDEDEDPAEVDVFPSVLDIESVPVTDAVIAPLDVAAVVSPPMSSPVQAKSARLTSVSTPSGAVPVT
jgi:hypothetical protein